MMIITVFTTALFSFLFLVLGEHKRSCWGVISNCASFWYCVFFTAQSVVEGRFGLRKAPLHSNVCSRPDSVRLCSATSPTAMRPLTTGNPWVLKEAASDNFSVFCFFFSFFLNVCRMTAIYLNAGYFDRCTSCCTVRGCRRGSTLRCTPSDHTLTCGYTLFLLVCTRTSCRQTR